MAFQPWRSLLIVAPLLGGGGCLAQPGTAVGRETPAAPDGGRAETEPECFPSADLEPPLFTSLQGYAYHWTTSQGCLPVSHDPALRPVAPQIAEGLRTWNAVGCSQLKFCPLVEASRSLPELIEPVDTDRYVHYTTQISPEFLEDAVTLTVKRESGRVLNAVAAVTTPDTYARPNWLKTAGVALGIDFALWAQPPETIMTHGTIGEDGPATLGPLDEQTLCTMYGQPAMCAEATIQ